MDSTEVSLMIVILFILSCGAYLYYERVYKSSLNETRKIELETMMNINNQQTADTEELQHLGWLINESDKSGFSNMILYFHKLDAVFLAKPSYDKGQNSKIVLDIQKAQTGDKIMINNQS